MNPDPRDRESRNGRLVYDVFLKVGGNQLAGTAFAAPSRVPRLGGENLHPLELPRRRALRLWSLGAAVVLEDWMSTTRITQKVKREVDDEITGYASGHCLPQDGRHAMARESRPPTNRFCSAILLLHGGENLFLIFQDLLER